MTEDQFARLMRRASSVQFSAVIITRENGETERRTEWFFNLSDADENEYDDGDLSETIQ